MLYLTDMPKHKGGNGSDRYLQSACIFRENSTTVSSCSHFRCDLSRVSTLDSLCPFYPHGGIPVPFSPSCESSSVEGIWQGLKAFERADVDPSKFDITTMKNLKRSTRTYGKVLGHRQGVAGDQLLSYVEARHLIYLPTYYWVLEHSLQDLLTELKHLEREKTIVFLDYETNCDINVVTRPLSHAGLIKLYLEDNWPHR